MDGGKDYGSALRHFEAAYRQDSRRSAYYMGEIYYKGLGVEKDFHKAFEMFTVGALKNRGDLLFKVGWCLSCGHGTEQDKMTAGI